MKKFESLGRSLSKGEQRKIRGGEEESLDGVCCVCSYNGMSSCWYTSSTCDDVCGRVYGPNNEARAVTCYTGCHMN